MRSRKKDTNKKGKTALIVATILAGLLLAGFIAVLMLGGDLRELFDLGGLIRKETQAVESTAADPGETTAPDETRESGISESDGSESETEPVPRKSLAIGVKTIAGELNPLYAEDEGDRTVAELTQLNLRTLDRNGQMVYHAASGESRSYNGSDYFYSGIADIDREYDREQDLTSFTVKLREDVYFSDGVQMTADDLIFNYYLRLQPDFEGAESLRFYDIQGLMNYYYNNSLAESQWVSPEELEAELASPGEELADYIRGRIREVLTEEAESCRSLWQAYQAYGYGNSAQEFFFNLYGFDLNYSLVGKELEEVCEDMIQAYGLDYRKLAEHYAIDSSYFDSEIENYAKDLLLDRKIKEAEGDPVDYVSGIIRLGRFTMKLKVRGIVEQDSPDLFDLYILPLHYYGDPETYDYNAHRFGLREDLTGRDAERLTPLGAGPYVYDRSSGASVFFTPNDYYYGEKAKTPVLSVKALGDDLLSAVSEGYVTVADIAGNKIFLDNVSTINNGEGLEGDVVKAVSYDAPGYIYFGISAENVSVGGKPGSKASKALRRGLATALAAFRDIGYDAYFGESVSIIDYPLSEFYGLVPEKNSPDYTTAYNVRLDGSPVFTAKMDLADRFNAVTDAVREYLEAAGYTYDEDEEKFVKAPKGASLYYEILVCGDEYETHPSYEALSYAKSCLYKLGISLDIHYMASQENMLVSIYMGNCEIWCAAWNTPYDPDLDVHYRSGSNIYGIDDQKLDKLIEQALKAEDAESRSRLYLSAYDTVFSWGIEVPCYQLYNYYVFNTALISADSIPQGLNHFWSPLKEITSLEVK